MQSSSHKVRERMINRLRLYLSSIEGAALLRTMRCMVAQGLIRGVLLFVAFSVAGYATYKAIEFRCPDGQTCVKEHKAPSPPRRGAP